MLILSLMMNAQAVELNSLSAGYYTPYGVQPGIKISADIPMKGNSFIRPQFSTFYRSNNHVSGMTGIDAGYTFSKNKNDHSISLGGSYLLASQITSWSIDLATGEKIADRELRHYAVPTLSYEYARPKWYLRASIGSKLSSQIETAGFYALELGYRFQRGEK